MTRFSGDLVKGSTELLALSVLATEELHGYALIRRLRELSCDRLRMNEGALYPLLHRLVRDKKLVVRERVEGGRTRKCYRPTAAGRRALQSAREEWRAYAAFVDRVASGDDSATEEDRE